MTRNFKDYMVWKLAMNLVKSVYDITNDLPKNELFALTNQIQRAVVSIPSNIAEGSGRLSEADFKHFLTIALGSAYEVETQLLIIEELAYTSSERVVNCLKDVRSVQKQLNNLIDSIAQ